MMCCTRIVRRFNPRDFATSTKSLPAQETVAARASLPRKGIRMKVIAKVSTTILGRVVPGLNGSGLAKMATSAKSRTNVGNANVTLKYMEMIASIQPRVYPAITPKKAPISAPRVTDTTATPSDIRVPLIIAESWSIPQLSVPKMCPFENIGTPRASASLESQLGKGNSHPNVAIKTHNDSQAVESLKPRGLFLRTMLHPHSWIKNRIQQINKNVGSNKDNGGQCHK